MSLYREKIQQTIGYRGQTEGVGFATLRNL